MSSFGLLLTKSGCFLECWIPILILIFKIFMVILIIIFIWHDHNNLVLSSLHAIKCKLSLSLSILFELSKSLICSSPPIVICISIFDKLGLLLRQIYFLARESCLQIIWIMHSIFIIGDGCLVVFLQSTELIRVTFFTKERGRYKCFMNPSSPEGVMSSSSAVGPCCFSSPSKRFFWLQSQTRILSWRLIILTVKLSPMSALASFKVLSVRTSPVSQSTGILIRKWHRVY